MRGIPKFEDLGYRNIHEEHSSYLQLTFVLTQIWHSTMKMKVYKLLGSNGRKQLSSIESPNIQAHKMYKGLKSHQQVFGVVISKGCSKVDI